MPHPRLLCRPADFDRPVLLFPSLFVRLQALAQALQCHIQVFSVGLPVLELGEEFKGEFAP